MMATCPPPDRDVDEESPEDSPSPATRALTDADVQRFAETVSVLIAEHLPLPVAWRIASALLDEEMAKAPIPYRVVFRAAPEGPLTEVCPRCRWPKPFPRAFLWKYRLPTARARVCIDCRMGRPPPPGEPPPEAIETERRCSFCHEMKPWPAGFRSALRRFLTNKRKCYECGMKGDTEEAALGGDLADIAYEPKPLAPLCACGCAERRHDGLGACAGCPCAKLRPVVRGRGCPAASPVSQKACGWPIAEGGELCAAHTRRRELGIAVRVLTPDELRRGALP